MSDSLKFYIALSLCLSMTLILMLVLFYMIDSEKKKTKYYKHRVKYEEELTKYYGIEKQQKKVIRFKKMQLFCLKLLAKVKGV